MMRACRQEVGIAAGCKIPWFEPAGARREWAHRRHRRSNDGDGLEVAVAVAALDDGEDPGVPMKDRPASTARVNPSTEVSASASSLHVSSSDWFFVSTESFAFRISPTHAT